MYFVIRLLQCGCAVLSAVAVAAVAVVVAVAAVVPVLKVDLDLFHSPSLLQTSLIYTAVTPQYETTIFFNLPFIAMFIAVTIQVPVCLGRAGPLTDNDTPHTPHAQISGGFFFGWGGQSY